MTNKPLIHRARELRAAMTDAEQALWRCLRQQQVRGARFRRQAPIGPYIVDFACFGHRLIIELDGGQHGDEERRDYDQRRTAFLERQGFRVLRFWNHEVLQNREGVLARIEESLESPPTPTPQSQTVALAATLPPQGRREKTPPPQPSPARGEGESAPHPNPLTRGGGK